MISADRARALERATDSMCTKEVDDAMTYLNKLVHVSIVHKLKFVDFPLTGMFITQQSEKIDKLAARVRSLGFKTKLNLKRLILRVSWKR